MGLLRTLLALAVIFGHAAGTFGHWNSIGGIIAVESFFMISGFYMALILSEKYVSREGRRPFWETRALKIFPLYWVALVIHTLAFRSDIVQTLAEIRNFKVALYVIFSNIFIFGQDAAFFMKIADGSKVLFTTGMPPGYALFPFPQLAHCWTLALELYFYLLVPFIARLPAKKLFAVTGALLALRMFQLSPDYSHEPWNYRFFPFELSLFLVGMCGYAVYLKIRDGAFSKIFAVGCGLWLIYFLGFGTLRNWHDPRPVFLVSTAVSIPFLFHLSREWKWDRKLGEFSYPLYLFHWTPVWFIARRLGFDYPHLGIIQVSASIILGITMTILLANPLEKWRSKKSDALRRKA